MTDGPRKGTRSSLQLQPSELPPVPRALPRGPETVINPEGRQAAPGSAPETAAAPPASHVIRALFPAGDELSAEERFTAANGTLLGHFSIVERIRTGGMGAVFKALDMRLNRIVALKVLPPTASRDQASVQRFRKEAQAAAQLNHENIARVFYIGEDHGLHFIAFEFVHGSNLRDEIAAQGQLRLEDALNYTLQLASALVHTSAQGVVHRDIKPSNVIITPTGRAKLVDLGLARNESRAEGEPDLTVAGTTLGTFDYISPEQARDPRTADIRSDIYSLGCTLYHLLTGEPPFPQGTMLQKLLQHQGDVAPDPAQKNRRVPPPLSAIVRKMMMKDPRRRYQSAEQLVRDLTVLASALGLQSISPEGLVWMASQTSRPSFVERYLGWIVSLSALLLVVAYLEFGGRGSQSLVTSRLPGENPLLVAHSGSEERDPGGNEGPRNAAQRNSSAPPTDEKPQRPAHMGEASSKGQETNAAPSETLPAERGTPPGSATATLPAPEVGPSPAHAAGSIGGSPDAAGLGSLTSTGNVAGSAAHPAPAIVLLGTEGIAPQVFPTLAAACAAAADGGIVELRFDGVRDEIPFRITRKITVRAAPGYSPVISFTAREIPAEGFQTRMITLPTGALQLSGVQLEMAVQDQVPAESWAMFSVQNAESLRLKSCGVTLINPKQRAAVLCEVLGSAATAMPEGGLSAESPQPLAVELSRTVCRVQGDLFCLKSCNAMHLTVEESLLAVDGSILVNLGNLAGTPGDSVAEIQMSRCTALFSRSFLRCDSGDTPRKLAPVQANIAQCLLSASTGDSLVTMTGKTSASDLRGLLLWTGRDNLYDRITAFWNISPQEGFGKAETLDQAAWLRIWGAAGEAGAKVQPAGWTRFWDQKPVTSLGFADLERRPNGDENAAEPFVGVRYDILPKPRIVEVPRAAPASASGTAPPAKTESPVSSASLPGAVVPVVAPSVAP